MKLPRLIVAGTHSGVGKTTVTLALTLALRDSKLPIQPFKVGPDYLDPSYHTLAAARPCRNLDGWMMGEAAVKQSLARASAGASLAIIEGVMGLYDGDPSSADLARAFDLPVLAVLDAGAMAQTVGALAQGLRDYGPVHLAGVIANRIASPGHAAMVAQAMRGIPLLGTLPRQAQSLPERHLGLVLPQEVPDLDGTLDALADSLAFDDEAWCAIAPTPIHTAPGAADVPPSLLRGQVVAIARDAAFAFLYPANVACLQAMGAQVTWFSPLADEAVPGAADAVYLPGGYPELHAETLSRAQRWQASIREAHARGVSLLAECGGMMALTEQLQDSAGRVWPMAGLLAGTVRMQSRLAALGPQAWVTAHGELRGHTFHHSSFETPLQPLVRTRKHLSGVDGEAIYRRGSLIASYFHAYFESCPMTVAAIFTGSDL